MKDKKIEEMFEHPYIVKDNKLFVETGEGERTKIKEVCNFVPFISLEIINDDGYDQTTSVKLSGISEDGEIFSEIDISYDEFLKMQWPSKYWTIECAIGTGTSMREHLRYAVQKTAKFADKKYVYTCTGWKNINDTEFFFLMPGNGKYEVNLSKEFKHYYFENEYSETDIEYSANFLNGELAPNEIVWPLVSFAFLSPLNTFLRNAGNEPATILNLVGRTGSKKSSLAAIILSFFGDFNTNSLPFSFKDTTNSLLAQAWSLNDVLTCIDDYYPNGESKMMQSTLQEAVRGFGNRRGRGRLDSQSRPLEKRYPRGNAVITSEFTPDIGESATARLFNLEIKPGMVNNEKLTFFQELARLGYFRRTMFAYTEWLKHEFLKDVNKAELFQNQLHYMSIKVRDEFRNMFSEDDIVPHDRIPSDLASLHIGFDFFLQFLNAHDIIDDNKKAELIKTFDGLVYEIAVKQSKNIQNNKPSYKFIIRLDELLQSERYYFANRKNPGTIENKYLGYQDDESIYLFKEVAFKVIKKSFEEDGEPIGINQHALFNQLKEDRLIIPGEKQITKSVRVGPDCEFILNGTKTDSSKRTIPISNNVYEALLMQKEFQLTLPVPAPTLENIDNFCFYSSHGHFINEQRINNVINNVIAAHNAERPQIPLPRFSCHTLRHTFATRLCEAHVSIKAAQAILGHSDFQTTYNIYVGADENFVKEEFGKVRELV